MIRRLTAVLAISTLVFVVLPLGGCTSDGESAEAVPITFLEFFDPACPFCAEMEPTVQKLEDDYADRFDEWRIIDVTTSEGKAEVEEFGVFITPTFVLLDANGEELDRVNGATTEENMVDFMERAISDVLGEGGGGPRETIEGEGTSLEAPGGAAGDSGEGTP